MLIRSRSARLAALALAATPLTVLAASPAFAVAHAGDDAVVDADVSTAGKVVVTSTKGLSRTTIVLCDGSVIVYDGWSGDQLSGDVAVGGSVRAVFQHSGNNTTPAAEALLIELAGEDAVNGSRTGAVAYPTGDDPAPCVPAPDNGGGEEEGGQDGGQKEGDGDQDPKEIVDDGQSNPSTPSNPTTPVADPVTTTAGDNPAPGTAVLGVTLERTENPAPAPAVAVSGETLDAGAELPRTGAGNVPFEAALAMILIAAGVSMQTIGRRNRSASFPG